MKWLRLYSEALHDPKVQRLPPPMFKAWVNLLLLANEQQERGVLPENLATIAFGIHQRRDRIELTLSYLLASGLLDLGPDGCYRPHNWELRQFSSDDNYARVKRFRNGNATFHETFRETPPDTDTDTDTDTDHKDRSKGGESERGDVNSSAPPKTPTRATASTKTVALELTPGQRERLRQDFAALGEGLDDYLGEALSYYQPLVAKGKHSNLYACVRKSLRTALERRSANGQHQNHPPRKPAADTGVAGWLRFRPQGETPH